jgi:hypothetical protein
VVVQAYVADRVPATGDAADGLSAIVLALPAPASGEDVAVLEECGRFVTAAIKWAHKWAGYCVGRWGAILCGTMAVSEHAGPLWHVLGSTGELVCLSGMPQTQAASVRLAWRLLRGYSISPLGFLGSSQGLLGRRLRQLIMTEGMLMLALALCLPCSCQQAGEQ